MTQPRKEQIKDLKLKFTKSLLISDLGRFNSEAVLYDLDSPGPYVSWLNSTITKDFGGCLVDSKGYVTSLGQGPFVLSAGQKISIAVPDLNSGNPIVVEIQAGDVVQVNGVPRVTTTALAARINDDVGYSAASNVNGYLRLSTFGTKTSSTCSVKDVTNGVLNAIFYSGASPGFDFTGLSESTRGIVFTDPDGVGQFVPVKSLDGSPCATRLTKMISVGGGVSTPNMNPGQKIYGRVSKVGARYMLSFKTFGLKQACHTSYFGNFSSLNNTDSFTITLDDDVTGLDPTVLNVAFSGTPANAQAVVDTINSQWRALTVGGLYVGPNIYLMNPSNGTAFTTKQIFQFPSDATFVLYINNGAPITITPGITVRTVASLAAAINAAIISAGQGASGGADVQTDGTLNESRVRIYGNTNIEILPGTISGVQNDMRALDVMGISPGVYERGEIARLYGADEIQIFNPVRHPSATISLTGNALTLERMGMSGGSVGVDEGEESVIPGFLCEFGTPESLEFGEVPNKIGEIEAEFDTSNFFEQINRTKGIKNAGSPILVGPDGYVNKDLINTIFDSIEAERIVLGSRALTQSGGNTKPRFEIPFGSQTLIFSFTDNSSRQVRVYQASTTSDRTHNARADGSGGWIKDDAAAASSLIRTHSDGRVAHFIRSAADSSTWADAEWKQTATVGYLTPSGTEMLSLGTGFDGSDDYPDPGIARLKFGTASTHYTLLSVAGEGGSFPKTRIYYGAAGHIIRTVNAFMDYTFTPIPKWSKDLSNTTSSYEELTSTSFSRKCQLAANNIPWTAWDQTDYTENNVTQAFSHSGTMTLGGGMPATAAARSTPRITIGHGVTTNNLRTAVESFTGGNGISFRTFRGVGFAGTYDNQDCFFQAKNARWDETTLRWIPDSSSFESTLEVRVRGTIATYYKVSGSANWLDTDWVLVSNLSKRGLVLPTESNQNNTDGLKNVLQKANIPKAWGMIEIITTGGGSNSINILDGYNISGAALNGTTAVDINLYANIPTGYGAVVCSAFGQPSLSYVPSPDRASGGMASASQARFSIYPGNSVTPYTLNTSSTEFYFSFVIFGRQDV